MREILKAMSEFPETDEPPAQVRGWIFLLAGTAALLLVAMGAFIWTMSGDATETDREWWGTPTPTMKPGVLPFG